MGRQDLNKMPLMPYQRIIKRKKFQNDEILKNKNKRVEAKRKNDEKNQPSENNVNG
jgi:hypothetical protein